MKIFVAFFVAYNIVLCSSETIEEEIIKYFDSGELIAFRVKWNQFKLAFDNAISTTLKEDYKSNIMNIYMADKKKEMIVSYGMYASDNSIQILFFKMVLRAMPRLYMTAVNVVLPSNVIRVEALLETMYVDTQYKLYRNETSVVDQGEQDFNKNSPFTFQQVQKEGDLTVIVQDCILIGAIVTSLVGDSISLSHDTLRLEQCKFSIEISAREMGQPPVIAPYFSNEKGIELMQVINIHIRERLMAQLQGAALSYINTTDVFGAKLHNYKPLQNKLFRLTRDYTTELVSNINKITIKKNEGILKMENLKISWYEMVAGVPELSAAELSNVTVSGLETAYSANTGGPYKLKNIKLLEAITFSSLQVRGNLICENKTTSVKSEFAAEILDYTFTVVVNITVPVPGSAKKKIIIAPVRWRNLEFSIIHMDGFNTERAIAYSFIIGYLSENLPKKLVAYLSEVYDPASQITEKEGAYKATKNKEDMENKEPDNNLVYDNAPDNDRDVGHNNENKEVNLDYADYSFGEEAKRVKHRRNVVSQSDNEEERISQKRSDSKKT